MLECYEFMPRIREMADALPDISERLANYIAEVEANAEIAAIAKSFPEVLCNIIGILGRKCDCEECRRNTASFECSILSDPDGYNPELMRLSKEHPSIYAMHSKFFDEAVSGVNRAKLLKARFRILSNDDLDPILMRADGSEVNPVVETYRREGRKVGRNEMCSCGSGKMFKKCCGA